MALKEISSLRNQRFSRSCRSMTVNVYAKRDVDQVVISTVMEVIHFSQAKYMPASCIIYFHKTLYLGSRGRRRGRQRVRGRRSKGREEEGGVSVEEKVGRGEGKGERERRVG